MKKFPSVTILTCNFNGDIKIFEQTLKALHQQDYPKKLISHIVMDGGSTNGGIELARRYGARVIIRKDLKNKALKRMALGILMAKNEIILFLEPDNIVIGRNWLQKMVEPFEDKEIVGTFSMFNYAPKRMPLVTRYCALIGANDPTLVYLRKSEKLPRYKSRYDQGVILSNNKNFLKVKFDSESLPTLGDNGHMVRRKEILPFAKNTTHFLHTDAFSKLLESGQSTYGVVKNSIIHHTGSSILAFFVKRTIYKKLFYDNRNYKKHYFVYNPKSFKDRKNLLMYIFFSLTIIQPLLISIKGYFKYPDAAWFLHPIMCWGAVVSYSISEFRKRKN